MKAALAVLALALLSPFAKADLSPGSPAPALSVKTWYKGEPVNEIGKTGIYVVEFWATWCGPCIESIPHLTETAHKNTDVTFIGVSVWEDDKDDNIKNFVNKMGDKMDYHVGYSGNQDGMAVTWMKEAAQNGIPAAFIVKDGVIQWVGHPMSIEKPLAEVKAGTFDMAASKTAFDKRATETRKRMAVNDEVTAMMTMFDNGDRAGAHKKLDELVAKYPDLKESSAAFKFQWLAKEDPKAWDAQAVEMAKSKKPESLQALRSFALGQASNAVPDVKITRRAIDLVLGATEKSDTRTLQYAVAIYERLKDYSRAAKFADQLLANLPDTEQNAQLRAAMQDKRTELKARLKK